MVTKSIARSLGKALNTASFRHNLLPPSPQVERRQFVDNLRVKLVGGFGGNGYPALKGIGGNGGSVVILADEEVKNLTTIKEKYPHLVIEAGNGRHSLKHWLVGESGSDVVIKVPCGIKVYNQFFSVIADLYNHGDKAIAAYGGLGGSSRNRYFGEPGQSQTVTLDYRALADISIIGFPGSGKSVLYKNLTQTEPEGLWIKGQLFHTKGINLADIKYDDMRRISCVDLPGLIEGAHFGKALGNKFLKHIERNHLMVFLIDVRGYDIGIKRSALENLLILNQQLEIYEERYLKKPAIIVVNKLDLENGSLLYEDFLFGLKKVYSQNFDGIDSSIKPKSLIQYQDIIPISCSKKTNLDYLKNRIRELIDFNHRLARKEAEEPESFLQIVDKMYNSKVSKSIERCK